MFTMSARLPRASVNASSTGEETLVGHDRDGGRLREARELERLIPRGRLLEHPQIRAVDCRDEGEGLLLGVALVRVEAQLDVGERRAHRDHAPPHRAMDRARP
jgi:hypothetical protein